jgi:type I restriction enzyme S subunit
MSGRAASDAVIPGRAAISVGDPNTALPSGWAWTPLTAIAELGTGHTPSRKHPEYWGGDVPWIGIRDAGAHHGGVIDDTLQRINQLGLNNSSARLLPKDTICLSRTASVGYVVKMGRDMATSQDFVAWTCTDALEPDFLMQALLAEGADIRRFGEGSTHTTIYFPEVKAFHIALPPLPEQRRIVAKIDSLTDKSRRAREHLDHIPRLVEKYKQAVLAAAFRGELTREWRAERGVTALYQMGLIGDVVTDVRYGTAKKCDYDAGSTPVLRIPNVQKGEIALDDLKSADFEAAELRKLRLQEGDLLVIRSNGSLGLVGRCAVVNEAAAGMLFAGYLIRLRPDTETVLPRFAHLWLQSTPMRSVIEGLAKSTSGVNNINSTQIEQLPIKLTGLDEQNEIIRRIDVAFAWIDRLASEATSARRLIDRLDQSVLAKAFRGELVPQDPADEPASVLLERIRAERGTAPKMKRGRKAGITRPNGAETRP